MPNQMPGQPTVQTARPRGWILCALYILSTAVLGAACVLAFDLLWTFLVSSIASDRDGFVIRLLSMLLSMAVVTGTFVVVYFLFRSVFKLGPLSPADQSTDAPKLACLVVISYCAFLLAYFLMVRQAGFTKKALDPDFLGALFAYIFYVKWPLWALLNPTVSAASGPKGAGELQP